MIIHYLKSESTELCIRAVCLKEKAREILMSDKVTAWWMKRMHHYSQDIPLECFEFIKRSEKKNPIFLDQVKIKDSNASFMRDVALCITMQFLI